MRLRVKVCEPQGHSGCPWTEAEPCCPLTPQCGKPEELGDQRAGTGRNRLGNQYRPTCSSARPRRSRSYRSDLHFLPRGTRRSALAGALRLPGRGRLVAAWARAGPRGPSAPGHRHRPRGGVCNSLESCTELGSAQPQVSSAGRRRSAAPEGAGRGREARCLALKVAMRLGLADGAGG